MPKIYTDKVLPASILQQMWEQCETDQFCDVVLIAGSEEIKISAHRCVLSNATDYFKGMFTSFRESREKEVKMPGVDGNALKCIIQLLYTGHIEIREDNVQELLKAANMLLLNNVVTECCNFLAEQQHPTNCLDFALLAEQYCCPSLSEHAKEYSLDYFKDVYKTEQFLKLNIEQLSQLLASDNLRVTSEEDVFNSLLLWIEHDRCERGKYKDELLKLVRMALLDPMFLCVHVKPVCTSTESLHLYIEAKDWQSLQDRSVLNLNMSTKSRKSYQYLMGITLNKPNNKMYINYYCPQRLKWMRWVKELTYRVGFCVATIGHNIYIAGGKDKKSNILNSVICLNMKTMTLSQLKPMSERRTGCCAAILNGFLYIAGGYYQKSYLSSMERWDPKTNTWTKVASMSVGRSYFGIAEFNKKLYAVGGDLNDTFNSAEHYDADQNVWTSIASLSKIRCVHEVVVANGLLYAIGGKDLKTAERYDSVSNKWSNLCSLSKNFVVSHSCTSFNDKVVVCYDDRVDEYDVITDKWKKNNSLGGLTNFECIFSYAGELIETEFAEN